MHAATTIRILSPSVIHVDIQAHPAHSTLLLCEGLRLRIERTENSAASRLRCRVHTLNPPEHAVSPVGPFVGDHHLAEAYPVGFRNQIKTAAGIGENSTDAIAQAIDVQGKIFGF